MTIDEAKKGIKNIRGMAWDDEDAHVAEDDLYEDFIKFVAEKGPKKLAEVAKVVLSSKDIEFSRWHA